MRLDGPLPTTGQLRSRAKVVDVQDKGKAAVVILGIDTEDEAGQRVCYNEVTYFVRGSGGDFFSTPDGHAIRLIDCAMYFRLIKPEGMLPAVGYDAEGCWKFACNDMIAES